MEVKNVVIVNDFNYVQGGASKVAIDTARLLKEENFNVYFFSAVDKSDENIDGINYISTNQNEALKEKNKLKGVLNGIYNFKAKNDFKKLLKMLDKNETIIHVHGWTKALSSSVLDIAFKMNFKVVLTLHDYFIECPNGGFFDYKENRICKRKPLSLQCIKCDCDSRNYGFKIYRLLRQFVQNKIVRLPQKLKYAIGISDLSIDVLKENLPKGIYIEKIYNPIDFDKNETVDYTQNDYYLYVGRISKEKGVDVFCQVITELRLKGIAVGDGSEKERLEKKYPNIEFTGWKDKNEVKKYMRGARCLIFPSLWYETMGLTILEAQAIGIPCLVNECCAGKEFVPKENTYNNSSELKNKIERDNFKNNKKHIKNEYKKEILKYFEKVN